MPVAWIYPEDNPLWAGNLSGQSYDDFTLDPAAGGGGGSTPSLPPLLIANGLPIALQRRQDEPRYASYTLLGAPTVVATPPPVLVPIKVSTAERRRPRDRHSVLRAPVVVAPPIVAVFVTNPIKVALVAVVSGRARRRLPRSFLPVARTTMIATPIGGELALPSTSGIDGGATIDVSLTRVNRILTQGVG